jgi:hypothetical protein
MMEVTQMLATHNLLVYIFLGFLLGGIFVPFIVSTDILKFKKVSFIYTMIFQAIITMIAFAGIVAVFTGDLGWSITTIMMMALWVSMMYIEIQKHKAIKGANLKSPETFKVIKSAFIKISFVQISLIVVMIALMMLKSQGETGL